MEMASNSITKQEFYSIKFNARSVWIPCGQNDFFFFFGDYSTNVCMYAVEYTCNDIIGKMDRINMWRHKTRKMNLLNVKIEHTYSLVHTNNLLINVYGYI